MVGATVAVDGGRATEVCEPGQLRAGALTIVVGDVVGSTAMLAAVGDERWAATLRHLRSEVRRCFAQAASDVRMWGDAFVAVCPSAAGAMAASAALQARLVSSPVQLRIGIDTGPVMWDEDDLVGATVHAAARVSSLAAPAEVLCTGETRRAADAVWMRFDAPRSVTLRGFTGLRTVVPVDWRAMLDL